MNKDMPTETAPELVLPKTYIDSAPKAPEFELLPLTSKSHALRIARLLLGPLVRFVEDGTNVFVATFKGGKLLRRLTEGAYLTHHQALTQAIRNILADPTNLPEGIILGKDVDTVKSKKQTLLGFLPTVVAEEHKDAVVKAVTNLMPHEVTTLSGLLETSNQGSEQERERKINEINLIITQAAGRK